LHKKNRFKLKRAGIVLKDIRLLLGVDKRLLCSGIRAGQEQARRAKE
jgi:hypothetical protein